MILGDIKTTNASRQAPLGVYPEMFLQLGAYANAHLEEFPLEEIDDLAIIRVGKDVDFAFFSTAPSRRREVVWTRTEAAARTRSDVDFAFFRTALSWRREIVWTRTEAAARTRSDVDFTFFSTAPSRRREIVWNRTEAAARKIFIHCLES